MLHAKKLHWQTNFTTTIKNRSMWNARPTGDRAGRGASRDSQPGFDRAQTTVLQDQLTLLNLISKNPNTPTLRTVEIIPTDTANEAPPEVEKLPLEDLVREAVIKRPRCFGSRASDQGRTISTFARLRMLFSLFLRSTPSMPLRDCQEMAKCRPARPSHPQPPARLRHKFLKDLQLRWVSSSPGVP